MQVQVTFLCDIWHMSSLQEIEFKGEFSNDDIYYLNFILWSKQNVKKNWVPQRKITKILEEIGKSQNNWGNNKKYKMA